MAKLKNMLPAVRRRRQMFASCLLAVILMVGFSEVSADTVVVVTNPSVTEDQVSRSFLRSVFGMRTRKWPDGETIKVFVLKDSSPLHEEFSKSILKTFPYNLRRIWDTRVFSGTGQYPLLVDDVEEMYRMIGTIENSVGYLPSSMADNSVKIMGLDE